MKPKYYIHNKTLEKLPYNKYWNGGRGEDRDGMKDLPKDGYPYKIEYSCQ